MLYNGDFYSLDAKGEWNKIWQGRNSTLYPRYFTSSGINPTDSCVYIFGGMGNECGEQIVGRRYYYDLHKINPKNGAITKLWEIEWKGEDVVPVRTMIIEGKYFYTICYPEYKSDSELALYRFSIEDGSFVKHMGIIPIVSDKMNTNAALYYDSDLKKLFVTTQVSDDDVRSTLSLYELSFPPVMQEEFKTIDRKRFLRAMMEILLFAIVLIVCAFLYFNSRHRKKMTAMYILAKSHPDKKQYFNPERNNAIFLFGDMALIDRDGNDIGERMSAQQKLILLLLVKYSLKNGLSTQRLSNIIWPDKDEEKVKNSRGVAINTLRKTLGALDGLSILFNNGYYSLKIDSCYCDLYKLLEIVNGENKTSTDVINIISRGKFLQNINDPLFDSIKEEVNNTILPILNEQIRKQYKDSKFLSVIELTDMVFRIDPLDEKALKYQIRALLRIKRQEDALLRYATFTAEYRNINDCDYPVAFDRLG